MSFFVSLFQKLRSSLLTDETCDNDEEERNDDLDSNNNDTESDVCTSKQWSAEHILDAKKMLTDNEIYTALCILKNQFGSDELRGFYDPQSMNAKRTKKFDFYIPKPARFVQILHDGKCHWYTVSNLRSNNDQQVYSYDSFYKDSTYLKNNMLITSLRKLMRPSGDVDEKRLSIDCVIESVHKQSDEMMCGLFAIAFAVDLCLNTDPKQQVYDESQMRSHLYMCLQNNSFQAFPKLESTRPDNFRAAQIIYIDI